MKLVPPFTYSFDGRFLVGVDGVEVVCYDGFDESPLWIYRHNENVRWVFCSDVGVLAIGDTTVVALTDEGEVEGRFDLPPRCHEPIAADFSWEWSEFVIATSSEVLVAEFWPPDDSVRQVHGDGIVDVAMSSFGEILTISEDGTARLYDVDLALYEVLHATDGIRFELATWSEAGWWLSGSHHADHAEDSFSNVYLWDADGGQDPSLQCRFEVELVDGLFVSDDGDLVAVRTGSSVQIVTPTNQLLAHLAYDRAVGPVCFVDEWVGVGLDRADANKLNLLTGALHRSDTHPERTHNSWLVHQAVYPEVATAWFERAEQIPQGQGSTDDDDSNIWEGTGETMMFKEELDAFHRKLVGLPDDSIGNHLRNGPMPTTEEECIYAANRTIPLLEGKSVDSEPGEGARVRLRMIKRQMEAIHDPSPELLISLGQIDEVVRDAEKRTRNDTILGCGCLTLIALAIIIPAIVWAVG